MTGLARLENFRDREVLITGGLGFIGSNLAIALADLGARVTLPDAMLAWFGESRPVENLRLDTSCRSAPWQDCLVISTEIPPRVARFALKSLKTRPRVDRHAACHWFCRWARARAGERP